VSVDNYQGAYAATQHLVELGHRKIAHIAGAAGLEIARQREAAYLRALDDAGLSYRNVISAQNIQWGYGSGYNAMRELLEADERPTAVFAASDELAIGAYRAIAESGLRIPQDISVVGFDNIEASAYTTPPLTTVHQPFADLGIQALILLLEMLEKESFEASSVLLPAQLVIRESTTEAT
jgi:DNA-binding LacI/PurR family transcriptional regulator